MAFEKKVLEVVRTIMSPVGSFSAEFVNGTLFVTCTPREAVRIESALLEVFDTGIILSRVDDEAAFDFV